MYIKLISAEIYHHLLTQIAAINFSYLQETLQVPIRAITSTND